MGTVSPLPMHRPARGERSRAWLPALRVTLATGDPAADAVLGVLSMSLRVVGARSPVRLYLYVNGELAEAWTEVEATFDLSLDEYGPGRHAVTARAVDALGRWAGASLVVTCAA